MTATQTEHSTLTVWLIASATRLQSYNALQDLFSIYKSKWKIYDKIIISKCLNRHEDYFKLR